jgi:uncharacterized membrane protein (DUF373 family)
MAATWEEERAPAPTRSELATKVTAAGPASEEHALVETSSHRSTERAAIGSMWVLEHAQDVVSTIVGIILVLLAATILVSGLVDFARQLSSKSVLTDADELLDRVLLVLILVEIVHTVVLSLRAHTLVPQPFIVVGLVAVIRKILFLMSNSTNASSSELALLVAMVAVFVAGLIAVNVFGDGFSSKCGTRGRET